LQRRKKGAKKGEAAEENADAPDGDDEDAATSSLKKPRIRISLPKSEKKSKKRKKGKGDNEDGSDDGHKGDDEKTPAPKKKKRKTDKTPVTKEGPKMKSTGKKGKKKAAAAAEDEEASFDQEPVAQQDAQAESYSNVHLWENKRKGLDGSFEAARANFTEAGPWKLPSLVEDRFKEIALDTLERIDR
jgi:hypothetical protein